MRETSSRLDAGARHLGRWGWESPVDLLAVVLGLHGALLVATGSVEDPAVVSAAVVLLVGWRIAWGVVASRLPDPRGAWMWRALGSVVAAGLAMGGDGGTDSPLFFWLLIVVASAVVVLDMRRTVSILGLSVVAYAGAAAATGDVNATAGGRFLLFLTYVAILLAGKGVSDVHRARADETRRTLAEVFDAAPMPLLVVSGPDVVANDGARELGLLDFDGVRLLDGDGTLRDAVDAAGEGRRAAGRYTAGEDRILRLTVSPIVAGGTVLVSGEDVTEAVSLEAQRRRFLDAANHQFRTPLSPILGYAELLASGSRDPELVDEAVAAITAGARRLTSILDRLATLARLQTTAPPPTVVVPLAKLVSTEVLARDPDLPLEIRGDPDVDVECDPPTVGLGIFELVENGRRHGVPPVTLVWRRDGGKVIVSVSDAGPGPDLAPTSALDQVWAPASASDVMPAEMGTRLGLAAAATLVRIGGGELSFHRRGRSWAFEVRLPAG